LAIAVLAGFVPLGMLAELVNIGTLAAFILVCGGVIVLRFTQPHMRRPFKTPFGITLPLFGVITCGALILFLPPITHLRFIAWLVLGLVVYLGYSMRHSHLARKT
jgi:basic amino acid/polyamine antiporter, APA family